MKEKGVGFGHWGGCLDGEGLWNGDGEMIFCEAGLCGRGGVRWLKEGLRVRFVG